MCGEVRQDEIPGTGQLRRLFSPTDSLTGSPSVFGFHRRGETTVKSPREVPCGGLRMENPRLDFGAISLSGLLTIY